MRTKTVKQVQEWLSQFPPEATVHGFDCARGYGILVANQKAELGNLITDPIFYGPARDRKARENSNE